MLDLNHTSFPHSSLMVEGEECALSSLSSLLSSYALVAGVPIGVWLTVVVLGTLFPKSRFGILDLHTSLKELTVARESKLNVLDVFRVVAILWVMMNHTGSEGRIDILERKASADSFKKAVHNHPIFGALLGNSALGVEVFLVLSGLLCARSWLRQVSIPFKDHYLTYVSRRVFRLFPSIALFVYIAAGPIMQLLLPRFHTTMISACGVSGTLSHLSFLGNWQDTPTCLGYLWYIGLDMQLHMVAPLLMHLLVSRPRLGVSSIVLLILVSSVIRAGYCTFYGVCNKSDVDIPFISYPDQDPSVVKGVYLGLWEMYARPYTKCGPFLVGMLFGWASAGWEKQSLRLSSRLAASLLVGGSLLAVATIYAILPEYWWPTMGANLYNVSYTALFRTVFAIALVAQIAALTLRDRVIRVSVVWSVLARLTFSAYLLHMPVVYIFNHLDYLQRAEDAIALLVVLPGVAAISFALATPFYVLVESPIGRLVSSWDSRSSPKRAPLLHVEQTPKTSLQAEVVMDLNQNVPLLPSLEKIVETSS